MPDYDENYDDKELSPAKLNATSLFSFANFAALPTSGFETGTHIQLRDTADIYENTGSKAVPIWTLRKFNPPVHNILDSAFHGDVLTGSITRGDILHGNVTPKIARLAKGTNVNFVLKVNATDVLWGFINTQQTQYQPANPTAQVNLMLGLAMSFTPSISGKVMVFFQCRWTSSLAAGNIVLRLRNGTGTAPVNGAALTGTQFSKDLNLSFNYASVGGADGMFVCALLTGLTVGTAYWFDAVTSSSAGTPTISDINCVIQEMVG